jgi:hypothetical protein
VHVIIESEMPKGVKVMEGQEARWFPTLDDLLAHYRVCWPDIWSRDQAADVHYKCDGMWATDAGVYCFAGVSPAGTVVRLDQRKVLLPFAHGLIVLLLTLWRSWFQGELGPEDAAELLNGRPPGTYP